MGNSIQITSNSLYNFRRTVQFDKGDIYQSNYIQWQGNAYGGQLATYDLGIDGDGLTDIPPYTKNNMLFSYSGDTSRIDIAKNYNTNVLSLTQQSTTFQNNPVVVQSNLEVSAGLQLDNYTPANTENMIYNVGGNLYWNGNLVASKGVYGYVPYVQSIANPEIAIYQTSLTRNINFSGTLAGGTVNYYTLYPYPDYSDLPSNLYLYNVNTINITLQLQASAFGRKVGQMDGHRFTITNQGDNDITVSFSYIPGVCLFDGNDLYVRLPIKTGETLHFIYNSSYGLYRCVGRGGNANMGHYTLNNLNSTTNTLDGIQTTPSTTTITNTTGFSSNVSVIGNFDCSSRAKITTSDSSLNNYFNTITGNGLTFTNQGFFGSNPSPNINFSGSNLSLNVLFANTHFNAPITGTDATFNGNIYGSSLYIPNQTTLGNTNITSLNPSEYIMTDANKNIISSTNVATLTTAQQVGGVGLSAPISGAKDFTGLVRQGDLSGSGGYKIFLNNSDQITQYRNALDANQGYMFWKAPSTALDAISYFQGGIIWDGQAQPSSRVYFKNTTGVMIGTPLPTYDSNFILNVNQISNFATQVVQGYHYYNVEARNRKAWYEYRQLNDASWNLSTMYINTGGTVIPTPAVSASGSAQLTTTFFVNTTPYYWVSTGSYPVSANDYFMYRAYGQLQGGMGWYQLAISLYQALGLSCAGVVNGKNFSNTSASNSTIYVVFFSQDATIDLQLYTDKCVGGSLTSVFSVKFLYDDTATYNGLTKIY